MRSLIGAAFAAVMVGLAALTALGTFTDKVLVEGSSMEVVLLRAWVPLVWLVAVPAALVAVGWLASEDQS